MLNTMRVRDIVLNLAEVQYVDLSENRCRIKFKGGVNPLEIIATPADRERLANAMLDRPPEPSRWWYSLSTVWGIIVCVLVAFMGIFGFRH